MILALVESLFWWQDYVHFIANVGNDFSADSNVTVALITVCRALAQQTLSHCPEHNESPRRCLGMCGEGML